MEIFIRQISETDAPAVTTLSHQLGYPLSEEQILQNMKAVLESKDHDAFVAVHGNKIVGWIGVAQAILIVAPAYCEINGMVIDEPYRRKGIGKMLIGQAKHWAKEKGNTKMKLRCNVIRTETHVFYQHMNFIETKQQKSFEINI
jgi:GNAT superfamily N-acetyltransferase